MIHFLKTALRRGWSYLLFLALIVFSLRDVLALPGTLGHSWDWEVSAFAAQIWGRLTHNFYIWDYQLRAGYYSPFRPDGWFSFLALPFSILGGEAFSKTFIVLLMFMAAVSMRWFAREVMGLNSWWSTAAGILYMFSPVVYSRIMAGHTLLLPYALLPLLLLYLYRAMQRCAEGRLPLRETIAAGLLLGLQGIHPSMMVLALAVVGIVIFFALLRARHWIATLSSAVMILAIFALLNLYWAAPMGAGYLSSGTIYHSGSFTDNPDQVNASSVISQRQDLFQSTIQSMQESLRQHAVWGFDTEFDYPVPDAFAALWLVISFLVPIAAFGVLLDRSKPKEFSVALALAGLLSATLMAGTNVVTGGVIYQWLMLHAFPVWAEFGNAVRGLPLLPLAYSALAPALLQRVVESMRGRVRYAVTALAALAGLIYVSPFLAGSTLIDPQDTLSLKSYQPSVSDQRLYDYMKNDPGNFRLTYIPPPWIFYPENYDSGYQWTGGLSPHPEFFFPYFNPEVWRNASDFRADIPGSIAGKLLGLAAVKYVIYPRARFVDPSLGVFPPQPPADNSASARFIDQILATQKDLVPVTVPFAGTLVFRNEAYLPRIYAASQSMLVPGDSDALPALADSSFFSRQPAIFFSAQQSPADARRLASWTDRTINVDPSAQTPPAADGNPSFLFHFSPPAEAAAAFSAPREQSYIIRAQAAPFQLSPPRAGDVSTATFAKPATSATIVWSSNLPYNDSLAVDTNSLQVSAYLDQSSLPNGYVQMTPAVEPLNLTDFPYLRLTSQVQDPAIQAVVVQLDLDLTGDGIADSSWTSPAFTHANFKTDELNVLQLVRQEFPDKPSYRVIGISVRFQMASHPAWQTVNVPARLYAYGLKDLGLYQQPSATKPGWVWQLPNDLAVEKTVSLSRSLENLDAQRFPILVQYQSDGPATLYAEMRLTVQSPAGVTSTIPAGAQLLRPFSNGTITLDVRDQLLQSAPTASARDWTATRVDLTVHPLQASQELRPTVLTLGLIGAQWRPASTDQAGPQPPTLLVDGKPVTLKAIPADANRLLYATDALTLSEGKHQVSAAYSNSNSSYAVESIQVEPANAPSAPAASPAISFESINPTRYRVHVTNARAPYFLVFSENFHAGWTAYIEPATSSSSPDSQSSFFHPQRWYEQSALLSALFDGGTRQTLLDHFLVNGYANSWRVDQTGSYDVVIEFVPQRLYEGGLIVSIGTFLGGVFFLGVTWFRRWSMRHRARTTV